MREEALQSELQVMRLALLKTNDFQVNGNTKQSNGTTIDDVVYKNLYCKPVILQLEKCG